MDTTTIDGFFDELAKIAGVGVDIHGYWRDPSSPEGQELAAQQEARAAVPHPEYRKPGFFGKLIGRQGGFDPKELYTYKQRLAEIGDGSPGMTDRAHAFSRSSRIKTPFDAASSRGYKIHDLNLMASKPALGMATDEVYSAKPIVQNLNRDQLRQLASAYEKAKSGKHTAEEKAFVDKINHLLKDKRLQFGRLEYE